MSFEPAPRFNVADYFLDDRLAEGRGEHPALHVGDASHSYAEVQAAANRAAGALTELGLRPGERVMIALDDGLPWVATFFGILKAGGVVVMVNPRLKAGNLAQLLDYVEPSLVVVEAAVLSEWESAAATALRRPDFLVHGDGEGHGNPNYEAMTERASDAWENAPTHRDDPAIWLFSGGTTGLPKGVVQSHTSFANTTELYAKGALAYSADDVTLSVPKLFFGYATGSNLLFPFAVGASAILFPQHPTAEILFEQIRRFAPTILINVPTMINQMLSHPAAADQDLSCLRFATSAGEALPAPLYHQS